MPGDLPSQAPVTANSFDTSFLSTYCVPNTVRWPREMAADGPDRTPALCSDSREHRALIITPQGSGLGRTFAERQRPHL